MTILIPVLLIVMTMMGTAASLFFKKASGSHGLVSMIRNINLWIGGGIYVGAALLNILVLKYMDYSVVLPLTSLTYVWTMLVSFLFLKEHISKKQIIGVALIVAGAFLTVNS